MDTTHDPKRYPIGPYRRADSITPDDLYRAIRTIESFPARLRAEVAPLTDAQLDTPYRDGGWTLRQVVHHCTDSHLNSFTRFKLALTESNPVIKPYQEAEWADLADSKGAIEPSLLILDGLHARWAALLRSLTPEQLARTFIHPERRRPLALDESALMYAWHSEHHLAHITALKREKGW